MLKKKASNESYYDLIDDFTLIECSFASQYGIRLRKTDDMTIDEFFHLLSGLTGDSPLGQIISIRSEQDYDVIKNYNKAQRQIHDDWQEKIEKEKNKGLTEEEIALKIEAQILSLLQ